MKITNPFFRACVREGALLLFFTGATLVATYPVVAAVRYPSLWAWHVHDSFDDVYVILWDFWWVARCLLTGENPFFTRLLYHPVGVGLFYAPLVPLPALLGSPLVHRYGDPAGTVLAVNVLTLATFVLTGYATFRWLRRLAFPPAAALLAALAFTFAPFRFMHLPRLHYLVSFWLPFYALVFDTYLRRGGRGRALGLGGLGLATLLSDHHHFVFLFLLAGGLLLWRLRGAPARAPLLRRAGLAAGVQALFLLGLLPFAGLPTPEQRVAARLHFEPGRPTGEHLLLAPDGKNLGYILSPPLMEAVLPPFRAAPTPAAERWPYRALYWDVLEHPGPVLAGILLALLLLLAFGLGATDPRLPGRGLWLALTGLGLVVALGPTRMLGDTPIPMPYRVLTALLPPLALSRYPAAFVLLALFAAAPVVAAGFARAGRGRLGLTLPAAAGALMLALAWHTVTSQRVRMQRHRRIPVYALLARDPHPGAVLELPLEHTVAQRRALIGQRRHGRPLVEGCVTRVPRTSLTFLGSTPLIHRLRHPPERPPGPGEAERLLAPFRRAGVRFVLVRPGYYQGDTARVAAVLQLLRALRPAREEVVQGDHLFRLW